MYLLLAVHALTGEERMYISWEIVAGLAVTVGGILLYASGYYLGRAAGERRVYEIFKDAR
jgi:uncharacterized membrane protein YhhN